MQRSFIMQHWNYQSGRNDQLPTFFAEISPTDKLQIFKNLKIYK